MVDSIPWILKRFYFNITENNYDIHDFSNPADKNRCEVMQEMFLQNHIYPEKINRFLSR